MLPTSAALPADVGVRLLALTTGAQVLRTDRPMPYVVSPDRLTGVDCQVPIGARRTARAIGTVTTRALLVGGHVLQSSARTTAVRSEQNRRLPWSHYLARPHTVEIVGKHRERDTAEAYLATTPVSPLLNLGAIAGHTAERVRGSSMIDSRVPFRSGRITLRWTAMLGDTQPDSVRFTVEGEGRRTVRVHTRDEDALPGVVALCEDLALHDWLLTTLTGMVARAPLSGPRAPAALDRIRPALDHLLHLWMPGARLEVTTRRFWDELERHAGFGRQWTATVQRIRDHLALSTLRELGRLTGSAAS
ncbi:SCO2521 family protein [Actinoplanes sp. SE50/110]|uniref:SCO2521 family protein n=1 Tax=Actinoplanes sp. (strain ATCC 31044 / CBS 674.73 / SE50/110) TaxID=134676 RepID=UPI00043A3F26|nr:SCO2521 family protein [Actinoplanes sp. SE50/110]